jgi:hypothetical protein
MTQRQASELLFGSESPPGRPIISEEELPKPSELGGGGGADEAKAKTHHTVHDRKQMKPRPKTDHISHGRKQMKPRQTHTILHMAGNR